MAQTLIFSTLGKVGYSDSSFTELSDCSIVIENGAFENMPKLTYADEKREVEFLRPKIF